MEVKNIKLGDICKVKGGYAFKSKDFQNNGVPVIKIANINQNSVLVNDTTSFVDQSFLEKYKEFIVKRDSLLLALSGATTGKFGIYKSENKALLNQRVAMIVPDKSKTTIKYIYYCLKGLQKKIFDKAAGAAQPNISTREIEEFEVVYGDANYQHKVVQILDKAQALIDNRKAQLELLSILTQSIFIEMFGDPQINNKNWDIGIIEDLTFKTQYGTSKKANEKEGKYPILRMNNISYDGRISLTDLKYIDLAEKEAEKYLVHKGELLFNRTNSKELVGKTAVYNYEVPVAFAGYLVKLIPNSKGNSTFISGYLNSAYGKKVLLSMAKNIVGMANINAEELKTIPIYIPPIDLQKKYSLIIERIEEKRMLLNNSLEQLEDNFNSLMQSAFKGELVRD